VRSNTVTSYKPLKGALINSLIFFLFFTFIIRWLIYDLSNFWAGIVVGYIIYKSTKRFTSETPRTAKFLKAMTIMNGPSARIAHFISKEET